MTEMTLVPPAGGDTLHVPRWESEVPLQVVVVLVSIVLWAILIFSIVGIFYALFLGLFFFLGHLAFIAYVRGSAVKLGPDQMPELHARVQAIAARFGMEQAPDAYILQAGGALNALATKLFRSNFIILFSELLEACVGDDQAADFIIAHEIGHLRAGHLRFQGLLLARFIPFLGGAYSRAREYTADRYGASIASDPSSAVRGLTILAAGPMHARHVNLGALVRQRHDMDTVMMKLGSWLATHPPIVNRIAALDRALAGEESGTSSASIGAAALIALALLVPIGGGLFLMWQFVAPSLREMRQASGGKLEPSGPRKVEVGDVQAAAERAQRDMRLLADTANAYHAKTGHYPADASTLYDLYRAEHPRDAEPFDPFDGEHYGYTSDGDSYDIFSAGEDRDGVTANMHVYSPGTRR